MPRAHTNIKLQQVRQRGIDELYFGFFGIMVKQFTGKYDKVSLRGIDLLIYWDQARLFSFTCGAAVWGGGLSCWFHQSIGIGMIPCA